MGVSGSGKSTLGAQLAETRALPFLEGDAFHTDGNVAKMRAGQPLCDEDRWPWLDRLGQAVGDAARSSGMAIAACSALKRRYRERLIAAADVQLLFVLLDADPDELARRMNERPGHYMPASLLASQLAALERPDADEVVLTLESNMAPDTLSRLAWEWAHAHMVALPEG